MAPWVILMNHPVCRTIASLVALGASLVAIPSADAHAVYMTYLRHDVSVTVSPENIDITVELTFFEMPSLSERRRMDRDRDGSISDRERDLYLAEIGGELVDAVVLAVDGRSVDVMPLYESQIDLLDVAEVAPAHHVLRLYRFARTPSWFQTDSRVVVKDALWPNAPALRFAEAAGQDGITIVIEDDAGGEPPNAADTLRVRCTSMPPKRQPLKDETAQAGMVGEIHVVEVSFPLPLWPCVVTGLVAVAAGVGLYHYFRRK